MNNLTVFILMILYIMMYVAVVLAAVASMVVGALWYSPVLFGNIWMKEMAMDKKDMGKMDGMWKYYAAHLVVNLVQMWFFAYALNYLAISSYNQALQYLVFIWFVFVVLGSAGSLIWEGKGIKVFSINVFHMLVSMAVGLRVLMTLS